MLPKLVTVILVGLAVREVTASFSARTLLTQSHHETGSPNKAHFGVVPQAQMRANFPPGIWNNNGTSVNLACVPLSNIIPQPTSLMDPLAYLTVPIALLLAGDLGRMETPVQFQTISGLVLAQFNAFTAYDDKAVPSYPTGVSRRPPEERTLINSNTAMLYAALRVAEGALPKPLKAGIGLARQLMTQLGLDPDNTSTDLSTPAGVGNKVALAALQLMDADGYNSLGDKDKVYNRHVFSQYTPFVPVNTAYKLTYPLRWQPLLETDDLGYFFVQQFITAQAGLAQPSLVSRGDIEAARLEPPYKKHDNIEAVRKQAEEVLEVNVKLTDTQKMIAEYFDDKFTSFGPLTLAVAQKANWTYAKFVAADLLHVTCQGDATIAAWKEKVRYDAVRPISAIRQLYEGKEIEAAVRLNGTKTIQGENWQSYLRTMPHADYPSGTACVCAAWVGYIKSMWGSDDFPDIPPLVFPKGCSRRESGITPEENVAVKFTSWDQFLRECGQSRLYAGVHFQPAIDAGVRLCEDIGRKCYTRVDKLLNGQP